MARVRIRCKGGESDEHWPDPESGSLEHEVPQSDYIFGSVEKGRTKEARSTACDGVSQQPCRHERSVERS